MAVHFNYIGGEGLAWLLAAVGAGADAACTTALHDEYVGQGPCMGATSTDDIKHAAVSFKSKQGMMSSQPPWPIGLPPVCPHFSLMAWHTFPWHTVSRHQCKGSAYIIPPCPHYSLAKLLLGNTLLLLLQGTADMFAWRLWEMAGGEVERGTHAEGAAQLGAGVEGQVSAALSAPHAC